MPGFDWIYELIISNAPIVERFCKRDFSVLRLFLGPVEGKSHLLLVSWQDVSGVIQWHAWLLQLFEDSRRTFSASICAASGFVAHCILLPHPILWCLAASIVWIRESLPWSTWICELDTWPLRGHCLHQFRSDRSHPVLLPLWESLVSQWGATHWKEIEWFEDGVWKSFEEHWRYDYCSGLARAVSRYAKCVRDYVGHLSLTMAGGQGIGESVRAGRCRFFLHFVLRSWRATLSFLF